MAGKSGLFTLLVAVILPAAAPAAENKPERKICKKFEVTGSRLGGTRVCKTSAEWDLEEIRVRKDMAEIERKSRQQVSPNERPR